MSSKQAEKVANARQFETTQTSTNCWFEEDISPGLRVKARLRGMMVSTKSEFQDIEIIETAAFGKTLILDGLTQSAQLDEFCYHESLVHPALLQVAMLRNDGSLPKTVFIGGGGELATAREVLRHKSVERVVMVDLDGIVVDVCRRFLPEWGGEEIATNPRLELVIGDAYEYLMNTKETFDVIIMDINDPVEAGPGIVLYTKEFYEHAVTRLNEYGVLVTQSGMAHSIPHLMGNTEEDPACFAPIRNTLQSVFDCVVPFTSHIPSFGGDWGFCLAFNTPTGSTTEQLLKTARLPKDGVVDAMVEKCIEGGNLGYYDGETHVLMFHLTKPLRKSLDNEKRIMTKDNPIYMFK